MAAKIEFVSRDDNYSPPKTVELARELVAATSLCLIF